MRHVLADINSDTITVYEVSKITDVYNNLVTYAGELFTQYDIAAPTFTPLTTVETTEDIQCEKFLLVLGYQARFKYPCSCTWCAEDVEESFKAVMFDVDKPLKLSKHCETAGRLTIRDMLPKVEHLLSGKACKHVKRLTLLQDALGSVDFGKNG
ncbi:hypothetical protein AUEXF2481DRAFT_36648 [Aureobasidium subglaciale EXF-2481]|uniref:Uncharacterized protein n=1 Tax=Aureobasidium subglaciale (strain EXF-2481) TaxID=1043005 RepID=A0A074YVG8_AURSE|nr:uncharacterized protein AUEXF2481DRAFT_36648 [Aureobasidium subglaciale EXF-2481]KEQ98152.1 hypothetical protein AUEXF2481DRAFT_36648 [Aureobasidium subglaciale EXF-2481]